MPKNLKRPQPFQELEPATHKKRVAEDSTEKRSVRANRGGGGPAKRVKAFDKATERSQCKKESVVAFPKQRYVTALIPHMQLNLQCARTQLQKQTHASKNQHTSFQLA